MANFDFLAGNKEYELFGPAAIEAERVYASAPAMCAVGCRKAMELAVKWVYAADETMKPPYRDNLQSLIHEPCFQLAVDARTWQKLPFIAKLGNLAVHTEKNIRPNEALASLSALFEFIQWIDYCYGEHYEERRFLEKNIPKEKVIVDEARIRKTESLLSEKDSEIEALRRQVQNMAEQLTAAKAARKEERHFDAADPTEFVTRKIYIDVDIKAAGWNFDGRDVVEEFPVQNMAGKAGQSGAADYVLFGKNGRPLAVVEAKRTSRDPKTGLRQAMLYANALEAQYGRRPMIFTTNGYETYFWDDQTGPQRKVFSIFSQSDLERLMERRGREKGLLDQKISDRITDRYYQKEAIRAVCGRIQEGYRKHLLVMATGTGKTRTASSLTDVLSRAGMVKNVLFLADRTALVSQARDDFKKYLPDMTLCNLCSNKDDRNARIVFSTYPTILNAIDGLRGKDGKRLYTPAHFDLIIIDESHRSIFKKYRAIFDYFDAILVGLTATPKMEVDRNTYEFFDMQEGVPTYAYDYETAVKQDKVLVPYINYEVKTKFLEEGITYDDLSPSDKARYEDDFTEDDGKMPTFIPSSKLNHFIFNAKTVDLVLQDLMTRGIKTAGGDRIGKTIIFAQNKRHAEFILERFNALYPQYKGSYAQRVICEDAYAQTIIDDFKISNKPPYIAVSVDMMDTGIDVPEVVNLVFFKKVRSKTKFWQMIGRGTRLCPDLECVDASEEEQEYIGKKHFLIFDYCGNFEFFRTHQNEYAGKEAATLSEMIYSKKICLMMALQDSAYAGDDFAAWRKELTEECCHAVQSLSGQLIAVQMQRQYVEKYKKPEAFTCLGQGDRTELTEKIAPLIHLSDTDEMAKRFDNFMYGMMLAYMEGRPSFAKTQQQLQKMAELLLKKSTIPQVTEKLALLKKIREETYWKESNALSFEKTRKELRGLVKFLADEPKGRIIKTILNDPVIGETVGMPVPGPYNFEEYRERVNQYVLTHGNTIAIYKLTHNIPLQQGDYEELSRVLTVELGSEEEYEETFQNTPFGLLIRKIAKVDHSAAMEAFSQFINDASLNQEQIAFIHEIIRHIEINGYMENVSQTLKKAPFDRPVKFNILFDKKQQIAIIKAINAVKNNALPERA